MNPIVGRGGGHRVQAARRAYASGPVQDLAQIEDPVARRCVGDANEGAGGTAATGDELTGKFGSGLEDTSIGDCRLVALFAEKMLRAILEFCNTIRGRPEVSDARSK